MTLYLNLRLIIGNYRFFFHVLFLGNLVILRFTDVDFSCTKFTQFLKAEFPQPKRATTRILVVLHLKWTSSEVCGQPALIQCATERHSSSVQGPCAIIRGEKENMTPFLKSQMSETSSSEVVNEGEHR